MGVDDRLQVTVADITTLKVDAIVNAANQRMLGGGGVDGAIHHAAGPELLDACRQVPEVAPDVRCPTGEARITTAGQLMARYVIHTVGPVWAGGDREEPTLLADCYRNSLQLAVDHGVRTIAFPAISTGVYGYPPDQAAHVALKTTRQFLDAHDQPEQVIFCCFSEQDAEHYRELLNHPRS